MEEERINSSHQDIHYGTLRIVPLSLFGTHLGCETNVMDEEQHLKLDNNGLG